MSETNSLKKKRPPKLGPILQDTQPLSYTDYGATSGGQSCNLDSTANIVVSDKGSFVVSPDSLQSLEELGHGQYGVVERVIHRASGHQFAVKRVPLKPGDESERRRLLMDVDILVKGTKCENIIKFYGALIWEGDLWILMELMDCSLDGFYKLAHRKVSTPILGGNDQAKGPFSTTSVCSHPCSEIGDCEICNPIPEKVLGRMASDIVNALSYLYSIKVIHRDIKPSNILINKEGIIKLCDFGISGYLVNSVVQTHEAGCRPYMAPERIDPPKDRSGYDIKSDVWSLGITMIEIAIGRFPYQRARNIFEQLKRVCNDDPPRLPPGRFSPRFEDFTAQCLRKDYQSRPKYDTLEVHPFIVANKLHDIKYLTQRILSKEQMTNDQYQTQSAIVTK